MLLQNKLRQFSMQYLFSLLFNLSVSHTQSKAVKIRMFVDFQHVWALEQLVKLHLLFNGIIVHKQ